ncbi:MAG: zinc-ribbon domain-containing protein [Stomatobaculum sp.]|nr:zinc-ribbon domain-containing protein [Stomatobaculum sp.]
MEETVNSGAKFCENCGAPIQPGQKFCDNCGQKIVYTEAPAAAPVPAEEPQQYQGFPEEPQAQNTQQENAFQQNTQQQNNFQQNSYQQNNFQQSTQQGPGRPSSNAVLPPRLGCAIAYFFSLLGCIVLYFLGDREDDFVRHHLNQAVVLAILQIVTRILDLDGLLETVVNLFIFFGWIVGMYGSVSGKKTEIPLISQVKIF